MLPDWTIPGLQELGHEDDGEGTRHGREAETVDKKPVKETTSLKML